MKTDIERLKQFLVIAKRSTYASSSVNPSSIMLVSRFLSFSHTYAALCIDNTLFGGSYTIGGYLSYCHRPCLSFGLWLCQPVAKTYRQQILLRQPV